MQETRNDRTGTLGWIGQAFSGVLLLILLGLHMISHHFIVEGGLRNYQEVLTYVGNPIILVLELLFLVVVTYHALLGVRSIIFDLGLSPDGERNVTRVLTVIGVITVAYGFYLAFVLFGRA